MLYCLALKQKLSKEDSIDIKIRTMHFKQYYTVTYLVCQLDWNLAG